MTFLCDCFCSQYFFWRWELLDELFFKILYVNIRLHFSSTFLIRSFYINWYFPKVHSYHASFQISYQINWYFPKIHSYHVSFQICQSLIISLPVIICSVLFLILEKLSSISWVNKLFMNLILLFAFPETSFLIFYGLHAIF